MPSQPAKICSYCKGDIPQDAPSNHTTCSEKCRRLYFMAQDLETASTSIENYRTQARANPNLITETIGHSFTKYMKASDAMQDAIARGAHDEGPQLSKDLQKADAALVKLLNAAMNRT